MTDSSEGNSSVSQHEQIDSGSEPAVDDAAFCPPAVEADDFAASQTSRLVAFAGLAAATAAVNEVDVDNSSTGGPAAGSSSASDVNGVSSSQVSLSNVASLISRRNYDNVSQGNGTSQGQGADSSAVPSIQDVRKFVFQVSRTDKRVVGGLRAHTFSSQAFFSSFAVGLAIGSIVAILLRILSEVGIRVLPFYSK